MSRSGKLSKEKSKSTKQLKLTDYCVCGETQNGNEDVAEDETSREGTLEGVKADAILAAINSMKTEFSSRFDGIMVAIESMKKEMNDCNERVSQADLRISNAEDDVAHLQAKINKLESKNKSLEDKLVDLETRSRFNNLRLVGLPEGAEGRDPCSFLEKWIPEKDSKVPPRMLIMRFLNYKDKQAVTGIHQLRKQFAPVRQELRNLGIRHGVIHPARLLVTYKEQTRSFKTPTEAREFIKKIQEDIGAS
ncbi:LINE-1 type transposase domain-containing 1 [Labeo rohita]|uniref:LINE-1 type transposase domain-containing 1 n=1 Tax=Labeo rohita TaxID=84645 RepID=A0A498MDL7_LABRO|nr:LINE-1 type transposase domain-containing 1 [Labeo rohita]